MRARWHHQTERRHSKAGQLELVGVSITRDREVRFGRRFLLRGRRDEGKPFLLTLRGGVSGRGRATVGGLLIGSRSTTSSSDDAPTPFFPYYSGVEDMRSLLGTRWARDAAKRCGSNGD
jgi:hypothetical protein